MTKESLKRYLISTGITFVATFGTVFFALIADDTFTFTKTALISAFGGAVIAGFRSVAKLLWELSVMVVDYYKKK